MKYLFLFLIGIFCHQIISAQNVQHLTSTLDSLLATYSAGENRPGFSVCITQNGQIVYEFQVGMAEIQKKIPISPGTLFNIGSISKQFTAACILTLEKEGKLRRTDSIQQYLPELPDFGKKITLNHLIAHTSGLFCHFDVLSLRYKYKDKFNTNPYFFSFYQKYPMLSFAPSNDFAYNNSAYMMLAMVVERVSGLSLSLYMEQHLFQPNGMDQAVFSRNEIEGVQGKTASYQFLPAKNRFKKTKSNSNAVGATGVHCTLRDMAKWQYNFSIDTTNGQMSPFFNELAQSYTLNDGRLTHYGMGVLCKSYKGRTCIEHGGGWNSFLVQSQYFSAEGIGLLVASNNDYCNPFSISDKICALIFPTENPILPATAVQLPVMDVEGTYISFNNRIRRVERAGDSLFIQLDEAPHKPASSLIYEPSLSTDTCATFVEQGTGFQVRFVFGQNGVVRGFWWEGGDYFRCNRFYEKLDIQPPNGVKISGKYQAVGFGQAIRIRRKWLGKGYQLKPHIVVSYPLEILSANALKIKGAREVLRFKGDTLVFGNDWVFNLTFNKK